MTRPNRTLQRLERILLMVPWLLENPGATLDEVAERFGGTREEVAQDLDLLGYCGLPGYGGGDLIECSIVGDRVTVRMADFFRRPLRLSVREAVTLLLAARALAGIEGLTESEGLRRAIAKLEATLGGDTAGAVTVDLRTPGDEHLATLRQAAAEGRVVELVYRSASKAETRRRAVEAWAVVGANGAWYLQGYCRDARAPRDFRLDRIRAVTVTDERGAPVGAAGPPRYEPAPGDHTVVLALDADAWWVGEWIVTDDVSDRGGRRRVEFRTPALEWVARLVLRLGDAADVVAPDELRARVAALARDTLARYRS